MRQNLLLSWDELVVEVLCSFPHPDSNVCLSWDYFNLKHGKKDHQSQYRMLSLVRTFFVMQRDGILLTPCSADLSSRQTEVLQ